MLKRVSILYGVSFLTLILFMVSFMSDQHALEEGFKIGKGLKNVAKKASRAVKTVKKATKKATGG